LALDKLNRQDDAVRAYQTAIGIKATEPLAWQGLMSLYERQGERKVDDYQQAALRLAEIYEEA
jgi:superkiller protein 3